MCTSLFSFEARGEGILEGCTYYNSNLGGQILRESGEGVYILFEKGDLLITKRTLQ